MGENFVSHAKVVGYCPGDVPLVGGVASGLNDRGLASTAPIPPVIIAFGPRFCRIWKNVLLADSTWARINIGLNVSNTGGNVNAGLSLSISWHNPLKDSAKVVGVTEYSNRLYPHDWKDENSDYYWADTGVAHPAFGRDSEFSSLLRGRAPWKGSENVNDCYAVLEVAIGIANGFRFRAVTDTTSAVRSQQILKDVVIDDTPPSVLQPESSFLFMEDDWSSSGPGDALLFMQPTRAYALEWMYEHAYIDACQNLPRLNDNSISNIIEICQFIYGLAVKHKIEIPRRFQDAWLAYRYSYRTTKLDVEDAVNFIGRCIDIGDLSRPITTYGISHYDVPGASVTCRCKFRCRSRELTAISGLWHTLRTYGLSPNFYVLWDVVPFSFMVDWFLPVGDILDVQDTAREYSGVKYDIDHICVSYSYLREVSGRSTHCYSRGPRQAPPSVNGLYWFDDGQYTASGTTIVSRVLDASSIFIGHK